MIGHPILSVLLLLLSVSFAYAAVRFAPWLPTHQKDIARALDLARLKAGERFADLGCGDGRVVREAARRGARATGYEIALPLVLWNAVRPKPSGARFVFKDLFTADVSDVDVVYLFGTPQTLRGRLREKLERELKPGARVLSYAFAMDGWNETAVSAEARALPIRLYSR